MAFNKELQISLLAISCIIITIINILCIVVIANSKKLQRKPPTVFIGNLIVTHMIQGICVLPLYTIRVNSDSQHVFICDGFWFTYMLTFYSATLSVFLLSVDRLLAIVLLNSYDKYVNKTNVVKVTIVMWCYVIALCILPFFKLQRSKALQNSVCTYLQPREWTIFMLIGNALLPYIFIVLSYIYVRLKLKKLSAYFATAAATSAQRCKDANVNGKGSIINNNNNQQQRDRKKQERRSRKFKKRSKITKLTFLIIFTYGLTWAPSIIYYLAQHFCPSCFTDSYYASELKSILSFLMKYINFFDAMVAPVLYCYFHDEFRQEFKRIICRRIKKGAGATTTNSGTLASESNGGFGGSNIFAMTETSSIAKQAP